jgi:hypothetical protein
MLSFFVLLLLLLITVVVIVVLRKNQQKHAREIADRTAPLPALDDTLPDFAPVATTTVADTDADIADTDVADADVDVVRSNDNWQLQVRTLRTNQQYDEALEVCRVQFPKSQAMQQAAIILRQQLKTSQENNLSLDHLLQNLYNLAALADIYSGTRHKASSLGQIMALLYNGKEKYPMMGYQKLKLLNKNDIRLLEQAWGKPVTHRRAEEVYAL